MPTRHACSVSFSPTNSGLKEKHSMKNEGTMRFWQMCDGLGQISSNLSLQTDVKSVSAPSPLLGT